jgi:type I restriction enzyme S subunit
MAGEWTALPLEDCMDAIIDYRGKSPNKTSAGVPLVTAKIVKGGRILPPEEFIAEKDYGSWMRRGMPTAGDVVMTTEAPLGEVAQLDGRRVALAQRVITLRGKPHLVDNTFLKFLLQSEPVQKEMRNRSTGTTVLGIRQSELRKVTLHLPPLPEQKRIAHILGTLDDKIELNRRMNATLEGISRATFKSWFVDFDPVRQKAAGKQPVGMEAQAAALLPDTFEDSEIGEVPKGWRVQPIGEFAAVEKGLSYKGSGLVEEDGIPMVTLGCFQGAGKFAPDNIKHYAGEYAERHLVSGGDLLVANTDMTQKRLILGSPAIIPQSTLKNSMLFTHHVFALRFQPQAKHLRRYIYHCLLRPDFRTIAEGFATGTTVLALPKEAILTYAVCLPPDCVLDAFTKQTDRCASLCEVHEAQTRTLATLRDTLLPKLLSGEIRVPEAEQAVEESTE